MIRGYIRLTTETESIQKQLEALANEGIPKNLITIELEHDSLSLESMHLEKGDKLVIWRLDVLGFFLFDLKDYLNSLRDTGVFIKSLQDKIDTSSSKEAERTFFAILNAISNNELSVKKSKIKKGLKEAVASGKKPGRQKRIDEEKKRRINNLLAKGISISAICKEVGINRGTFYNWKEGNKPYNVKD